MERLEDEVKEWMVLTVRSSWNKEGLGLVGVLHLGPSAVISEIGDGTDNQRLSYIGRVHVQL